jgi:hypothetical protein
MIIDPTITLGNLLYLILLLLGAIVFYFKGYVQIVRLLDRHDVRLDNAEEHIENHREDIRELYQTKVDKA